MTNNTILKDLFEVIQKYSQDIQNDNNTVVDYTRPADLAKIISFPIDEEGVTDENFKDLMHKYLQYSARTGHKQFMNQLFSGLNLPAFAGDVLTSINNTSMYTYEVAPVATMIENEMIKLMSRFAGYKNGEGIFVTGGSNANLIAMFSARNRAFPQSRIQGLMHNSKLKAFVSEDAHYSYENAANILGIGAHNVVKIPVDQNGAMIPAELDKAIVACKQQNDIPFFVGATCGTTVRAAFDPLDELAPICKKHNLWFHADGAFGGSLIMSPKNQHLFSGLHLTDSFAWDAHKLMNIPLISSVLLVKEKGTLRFNLSDINTDYIYHENSEIEDLGKKSIQCGRRVDAAKLWFAWKYHGLKGYAKKMDHLMEMARYTENIVNTHPKLELFVPRQSLTVCFRYIPEFETNLDEFNFAVRESLRKQGKSLVNVAWINKTLIIRFIISNSESQFKDIDQFFKNFLKEASEMEIQEQSKKLISKK